MTTRFRSVFVQTMATVMVPIAFAGGCGGGTTTGNPLIEDTSTSGTVASAVGGALSGSGSSGSLSYQHRTPGSRLSFMALLKAGFSVSEALAAVSCPTIGAASGCTAGANQVTLSYGASPGCSFTGSMATWTGSQTIAATGITCAAFPSNYGSTVTRTFGAGTTRTAASGSKVRIDTSPIALAADGNSYVGGSQVTFSGGIRTQLAVSGINYIGTNAAGKVLFDHTLTTSPVGGTASPLTITSGVVNGTMTTFHNLAKIAASSTFSNVTFTAGCCQPVSGSITTTFSATGGNTPPPNYVGVTEKLTFTGCGTATYSGPEGNSGDVTLAHCL